jgi:capsular exopolysaccharide synthesis family protein
VSRIEEVLRRASLEKFEPSKADGLAQVNVPRVDDDEDPASLWSFDESPESAPAMALKDDEDLLDATMEAFAAPLETVSAPAEPFVAPRETSVTVEPEPLAPVVEHPTASSPADVLITRTLRLDAIEQYRKLGAALHEAQIERGFRSLLCTSALMGEGKTVTASNLALTLSESYGRRVLLIDADLRRPQVHVMFGISNETGLVDVLDAPTDTKLAIHQVTARLSVLTAGISATDPMSGLTSARLRQVISEATQRFDWVIVDTPPVMILPDARVLVSTVDAVLLVVRAGSTPFRTELRLTLIHIRRCRRNTMSRSRWTPKH